MTSLRRKQLVVHKFPESGKETMTASVREQQLIAEKQQHFAITVSVSLDLLDFPFSRDLDPENVRRLTDLFEEVQCAPERPEYHIPVIVDRANLRNEWIRQSDEKSIPIFEPPPEVRLEALRGRHRVSAARALDRPPSNWVVDVYDSGISPEARKDITESDECPLPPDDGEFYYKVRLYQGVFGNRYANTVLQRHWIARWKARRKGNKGGNYLQRLAGHAEYSAALDELRDIKALYSGLKLPSVGRMLSTGFKTEFLGYLRNLKFFWSEVFDQNETAMKQFCTASLSQLQRTAPGACRKQNSSLRRSGFQDCHYPEIERERYCANFIRLTQNMMAPSLDTFFQNLTYFQTASRCLKRLVKLRAGEDLRTAFERSFTPGICWVQVDEDRVAKAWSNNVFDVSYRQLVLYSYRHMNAITPIKKPRKVGPTGDFANKRALLQFALLANKLGFKTILDRDAEQQCVDLSENLATVTEAEEDLTDYRAAKDPELCGTPKFQDFLKDRKKMFLHELHKPFPEQEIRLSSFFIARSHYFSLFGEKVEVNFSTLSDPEPLVDGKAMESQLNQVNSRNQESVDEQQRLDNFQNELASESQRLAIKENSLKVQQQALDLERQKLGALQHNLTELGAVQAEEEMLRKKQAMLEAGQVELKANEAALEAAKAQLDNGNSTLEALKAQVKNNEDALAAAKNKLNTGHSTLDGVQAQIKDNEDALATAKTKLSIGNSTLEALKAQVKNNEDALAAANAQLSNGNSTLESVQAQIRNNEDALAAAKNKLSIGNGTLEALKAQVKNNEDALSTMQGGDKVKFFEVTFEDRDDGNCGIRLLAGETRARDVESEASKYCEEGYRMYCFDKFGFGQELMPWMCTMYIQSSGNHVFLFAKKPLTTEQLMNLEKLKEISLKRRYDGLTKNSSTSPDGGGSGFARSTSKRFKNGDSRGAEEYRGL